MLPEGNGLICVGVPRERLLLPNFVDSRDRVLHFIKEAGLYGGIIQQPGCRIDMNRNLLGEEFLKNDLKPEWLLQLDNDMKFPDLLGERLVKWRLPVVGGLYFHTADQHEPVCYWLGNKRDNRYGRPTWYYSPCRDEVYDFLLANNVPRVDDAMAIEEPVGNALLKCDGIGTGAMLLHRSVLERLAPPWFEFQGTNGEDLMFCKRVQDELNLPIHVDMSSICGHINLSALGPSQFREAYEARGYHFALYGPEHMLEWLWGYFRLPKDQAKNALEGYSPELMGKIWHQKNPQTPEEVLAFYQDETVGEMYVIELLRWNMSALFNSFRKQLIAHRNGNVLEIGGGIGTLSMQLALQNNNVVMVEPNETLRNFAKYRWRWIKSKMNSRSRHGEITFSDELPKCGKFNTVVALDVFEHIHGDELPSMLKQIGEMTLERAYMFHHNNWEQQDLFPFHYNHSAYWESWLRDAGFYPISPPYWSVKIR